MVCERWLVFENFLADMGERPARTTLGRVLDIGNYEPGNVFWQTRSEQKLEARNKLALTEWRAVAGNRTALLKWVNQEPALAQVA